MRLTTTATQAEALCTRTSAASCRSPWAAVSAEQAELLKGQQPWMVRHTVAPLQPVQLPAEPEVAAREGFLSALRGGRGRPVTSAAATQAAVREALHVQEDGRPGVAQLLLAQRASPGEGGTVGLHSCQVHSAAPPSAVGTLQLSATTWVPCFNPLA